AHFWIEAALALIAALFAIALRRQKRLFKPSGFIMLSVGLLLDMLMPHTQPIELWMRYWRAAALTLVLFGVIQLALETVLVTTRRRTAVASTIFVEVLNTALYSSIIARSRLETGCASPTMLGGSGKPVGARPGSSLAPTKTSKYRTRC